MSWPEDRKLLELQQKLSSIDREFAHWLSETEEKGPLPAHNSQVLRVTRQLGALTKSLSAWLDRMEQNSDLVLPESRQLEVMILDVHRIWEFFRSKLAQRCVAHLEAYLIVADDFAWACYDRARAVADSSIVPAERIKEPPLVFLNGGLSPYTMSRGAAFEAEFVEEGEITRQQVLQVLKDLPIPVIGVPWYQICHLPDAIAIGHEVGHNVEDDFALTPLLRTVLETAMEASTVPEERRAGWRAWLGEVFADLYGILSGGPAFVSGLMDFFALTPKEAMEAHQPDPSWLAHPPGGLRILLNLRALELLNLPAPAADLRAMWTSRFPHHAMSAFDGDIDPIVSALLDERFPELSCCSLPEVIPFGPTEMAQAEAARDGLIQGLSPAVPIRAMVAGARLAFERDPDAFVRQKADVLVLATVAATRGVVVRGEATEASDAADIGAGEALFERLRTLRRE